MTHYINVYERNIYGLPYLSLKDSDDAVSFAQQNGGKRIYRIRVHHKQDGA